MTLKDSLKNVRENIKNSGGVHIKGMKELNKHLAGIEKALIKIANEK